MKCLPDHSLDAALSNRSCFGALSQPLELELKLTEIHRSHAGSSKTRRELAFLHGQFPAILQPIQEGDLFAGRVLYPMVSFGPEPGGLGYACREEAVRRVAEAHHLNGERLQQVESMLEYWRREGTEPKTRAAYPTLLARTLPSDRWTEDSHIAFPLYRMAGLVPDYAKLIRLGLPGLKSECLEKAEQQEGEARDFLLATAEAMDLLANSCLFYAEQARQQAQGTQASERQRLERVAESLENLTKQAPGSFQEGIQLVWLYALHSGSWNHGRADVYLGSLLVADLEQHRLQKQEALEMLCSWWRLMKAYDNQYNNRVYIGGRGRPNEEAADRFALLAMEATRIVRLNQPQLSLRFHKDQNPALMAKALRVIGEGTTFPMLYNDDVNVPAVMEAFGVDEEEALQYHPYGCGEYCLASRSAGSPNGVINLVKCLEAALHGGIEAWSGQVTGPASPQPEEMKTFEEVWSAYTAQVEHHVAALAQQQALEYQVTGREAPFLLLSALHDDCLSRAKPLFSGGVRYLGGTLETYGNTNAADSLHAIAEVVFRKRQASLREVVEACDANFEGEQHARLRRLLLAVPKYGNDDEGADAMAERVHTHVCLYTRNQAEKVGLHSYLVVIINNWANVIFGSKTCASPEGRLRGETLANGNNPQPGNDRSGATAFLNSLSKLNPAIHAGAVQNMKFSRELFSRYLPKLEAMLKGYWRQGGTQAMITVVSPEDLRAAIKDPSKWGHLMVRVGGFSSRFVDLPPGAQQEVLRRTCHE